MCTRQQFLLTAKGTYTLTVSLSDEEPSGTMANHSDESAMHAPGSVLLFAIRGSPFEITVIPAALHVPFTLNYTYEIAADREAGLPVAYAGETNLWQFTARDRFGNIRLNNDTIEATMYEVHTETGVRVPNKDVAPTNTSWNETCECYDVTFRTEKSMRYDDRNFMYNVSVTLAQMCKRSLDATGNETAPHCTRGQAQAVPGSDF
eukprot:COSAG01_NODE_27128_length_693_cov_1.749158_1_plen_204_part_10